MQTLLTIIATLLATTLVTCVPGAALIEIVPRPRLACGAANRVTSTGETNDGVAQPARNSAAKNKGAVFIIIVQRMRKLRVAPIVVKAGESLDLGQSRN